MTIQEYFGEWAQVIDSNEVCKTLLQLKGINNLCPLKKNIFRAFKFCPYNDCRIIILGQDPYPQKDIATGIAFGNKQGTINLSPSLKVIEESLIDYSNPNKIQFDCTLESWCKQGVLLLNSALTCEVGRVGIHFELWRNFISKFIQNFSITHSGTIWILLGNQAKLFKNDIKGFQYIVEENHPSYYARTGKQMPNIFNNANKILKELNNNTIKFYGI